MTEGIKPAPLTKLGLSDVETREIGTLFRELASYLTVLSSGRMSDEVASKILEYNEAEKKKLQKSARTEKQHKANLIEALEGDKRNLEVELLRLEVLLKAILIDSSRLENERAKIEAIIDYLSR